jgi:transcriptional regulator with XRE-family HTH domain
VQHACQQKVAPRGEQPLVTSCFTEAPSLNETLCRALLRAGLTEEDLAARLGVDPKTVRRWIEGRALPYRRHRWALAALLAIAETDLWPQLRSSQPRIEEVVAVYPHLGTVPREVWLGLYGLAEQSISILDADRPSRALDREVVTLLGERAQAGVTIRLCLADPGIMHSALDRYAPLRDSNEVEIRLFQGALYSLIYRADGQLLAAQNAYAIPAAEVPVLHLQQTDGDAMFATYVQSFERIWADAGKEPPVAQR